MAAATATTTAAAAVATAAATVTTAAATMTAAVGPFVSYNESSHNESSLPENMFMFANDDAYMLSSFANRPSALVPRYGYLRQPRGSIYTRVFYNETDERQNFLSSDVGSLASEIFSDNSYYIFGIRNYIRIATCRACDSDGNCSVDHLLQELLADVKRNIKFKEEVSEVDLILTRDFKKVKSSVFFNGTAIMACHFCGGSVQGTRCEHCSRLRNQYDLTYVICLYYIILSQ